MALTTPFTRTFSIDADLMISSRSGRLALDKIKRSVYLASDSYTKRSEQLAVGASIELANLKHFICLIVSKPVQITLLSNARNFEEELTFTVTSFYIVSSPTELLTIKNTSTELCEVLLTYA